MLLESWSDSEGANGSGIYWLQLGSGIYWLQLPSGAEAPTRWTRLVPKFGFVPDPFASSLSD